MSTNTDGQPPPQVDVRGPRFTAWVTTAVLVLALIASTFSAIGAAMILAAQAIVFAIGAARGPRQHPYGLVFANLIAPRLSRVTDREPVPPLKFAQLVGFFCRRRCHRVRRRHPASRPDRHGFRTRGGLSQFELRHLPWLPDLPARCTSSE